MHTILLVALHLMHTIVCVSNTGAMWGGGLPGNGCHGGAGCSGGGVQVQGRCSGGVQEVQSEEPGWTADDL